MPAWRAWWALMLVVAPLLACAADQENPDASADGGMTATDTGDVRIDSVEDVAADAGGADLLPREASTSYQPEDAPADSGPDGAVDPAPDASTGVDASAGCVPVAWCGSGGWRKIPSSSAVGFSGRRLASAVWGDGKMYVLGGDTGTGLASASKDLVSYDPETDAWARLPDAPFVRRMGAVALWTGQRLLVWGGSNIVAGWLPDGAEYDPATRTWSPMPDSPTGSPAAVWSPDTQEVIAWDDVAGAGAAYAVGTRTWRPLPPLPMPILRSPSRAPTVAVWSAGRAFFFTGTTYIQQGGHGDVTDSDKGVVLAYAPSVNQWTVLPPAPLRPRAFSPGAAVHMPPGFLVWGGSFSLETSQYTVDGSRWDASAQTWALMPALTAAIIPFPARGRVASWSDGNSLWIWGGHHLRGDATDPDAPTFSADGAVFSMASSTWAAMPAGGPAARSEAAAVWTGAAGMFWGGTGQDDLMLDDGAIFCPKPACSP